MRRFHSSRETVDAAGTSLAELCGRQEMDQETQRNSNNDDFDPVEVARVRLASEGTGNSEVV